MPCLNRTAGVENLLGSLSRGEAGRARVWGTWLSCLSLGNTVAVVIVGGPLARCGMHLFGDMTRLEDREVQREGEGQSWY